MRDRGLSPQRDAFARAVASGKSQADAYREAYPRSQRWTPRAVQVAASRLMDNAKVLLRVRELQAQAAERAVITETDVLLELKRIALASLTNVASWDADGRLSIVPSAELTEDQVRAVASVKHTVRRYGGEVEIEEAEIKLHPKVPALQTLARIFGLLSDRLDPAVLRDEAMKVAQEQGLDPEELVREAEAWLRDVRRRRRE